jgi:hypothetical protein
MDLSSRIQHLEDLVRDAKSMPLSSSALLNREELLELVEELKVALPEEIKQARWVVKDREELLSKARRARRRRPSACCWRRTTTRAVCAWRQRTTSTPSWRSSRPRCRRSSRT